MNIFWILVHRIYAFSFVFFLALFVTALVLAAISKDPRKYPQSVDQFRAFCEILTIIFAVVYLVLELDQMVK